MKNLLITITKVLLGVSLMLLPGAFLIILIYTLLQAKRGVLNEKRGTNGINRDS